MHQNYVAYNPCSRLTIQNRSSPCDTSSPFSGMMRRNRSAVVALYFIEELHRFENADHVAAFGRDRLGSRTPQRRRRRAVEHTGERRGRTRLTFGGGAAGAPAPAACRQKRALPASRSRSRRRNDLGAGFTADQFVHRIADFHFDPIEVMFVHDLEQRWRSFRFRLRVPSAYLASPRASTTSAARPKGIRRSSRASKSRSTICPAASSSLPRIKAKRALLRSAIFKCASSLRSS